MRVYIASKYIAHKELNRKIYEELVRAKIPVFLPECINMDAIDLNRSYIVAEKCFAEIEKCNVILAVCPFGKSVSSELGYAIALRRALKQEKVIIALYLDFESAFPYYEKNGILTGNDPETTEFNDIMNFLYMGRKN